MEQIVSKILEIEEQAHAITKEAETLRTHFDQKLAEDKKQLEQTLLKRAENRLVKVCETEQATEEEQIAALKAQGKAERAALKTHFSELREEWIQDITKAVIGG